MNDNRFTLFDIIMGFALAGLVVMCFVLGGCASKKSVSHSDGSDNVRIEYLHDTCFLQTTDTIYIEVSSQSQKEESTDIEFGEGGGSVIIDSLGNLLRLENVKNLRLSRQQKEQAQTIERQARTIEVQTATIDSLRAELKMRTVFAQDEKNTKDIKPTMNAWQRFFYGSGYAAWGILLLALLTWIAYRIAKWRGLFI